MLLKEKYLEKVNKTYEFINFINLKTLISEVEVIFARAFTSEKRDDAMKKLRIPKVRYRILILKFFRKITSK